MMIMMLQIKLLQNLVGLPEYGPHQSCTVILFLKVMLLDHDKPTNYEEAMMSPDSAKWLDGHEIWDGIHVWEQSVDFGGLAW